MDDFDDTDDELFNEDFDDNDTTLANRGGIKRCAKCSSTDLGYRVDGRFVIRTCRECGHEMEE